MPIQAMSKKDFQDYTSAGGHPEYVTFLKTAKVGAGGSLTLKGEGVSRQTIKNRLATAAKITGRTIKFYRSPADKVVVQVVE